LYDPPFFIGKPSISIGHIPWLCQITRGYMDDDGGDDDDDDDDDDDEIDEFDEIDEMK
jgi:hypothetical protein